MRFSQRLSAALAALLVPALVMPALAQSVVSEGQSFVQGRLLPGTAQNDGTRLAGLRLTMAEGWKTYWRNPGEAGVPPAFDWTGSQNVAGIEILWPRPDVFESFGMQTIGYHGRVVLPMVVTPQDPGQPISLSLSANLGVCKDICVLEHFTLSERIEHDQRPVGAQMIDRAHATVPPAGEDAGLTAAECRITGAGRERGLEMRLAFREAPAAPVVVVEGADDVWISNIATAQGKPGKSA